MIIITLHSFWSLTSQGAHHLSIEIFLNIVALFLFILILIDIILPYIAPYFTLNYYVL